MNKYALIEYSHFQEKEDVMLKSIDNFNLQTRVPDNRKLTKSDAQLKISPSEVQNLEDVVTLGKKSVELVTYSILNKEDVVQSGFISLRELIVKILEEQGVTTQIALEDTSIDVSELTPEQAQELISEDGYLGVEQTSDRIVQFAISLMGNDPGKLEEIKGYIDKGFQMASNALGGNLPEISMRTYDAIMEKLDAWVENFDQST